MWGCEKVLQILDAASFFHVNCTCEFFANNLVLRVESRFCSYFVCFVSILFLGIGRKVGKIVVI